MHECGPADPPHAEGVEDGWGGYKSASLLLPHLHREREGEVPGRLGRPTLVMSMGFMMMAETAMVESSHSSNPSCPPLQLA